MTSRFQKIIAASWLALMGGTYLYLVGWAAWAWGWRGGLSVGLAIPYVLLWVVAFIDLEMHGGPFDTAWFGVPWFVLHVVVGVIYGTIYGIGRLFVSHEARQVALAILALGSVALVVILLFKFTAWAIVKVASPGRDGEAVTPRPDPTFTPDMVDHPDENYRRVVAECMNSGRIVTGHVDDEGKLHMESFDPPDGSSESP
jgi:hypothetical protein